jgi:cyclopropane fatty-acyl-phospholipid synthase-like methyltransferase
MNLRDLVSLDAGEQTEPSAHYDRVTAAWRYLLGENLHYGVFATGGETLADATDALTRLMAERAELFEGCAVIDVGCGTGAPACALVDRFGCRVTGISTSAVCIEQARQRADERRLAASTEFVVADGMANGFPDGVFDRAWVMESSHLMPDKGRMFGECARVLRRGGRLVLCDIVLKRPIATREVVGLRYELLLLREVFGRAKMETFEFYERALRSAGFTDIDRNDLSDATLPTFDRWQDNAERSKERCVALFGERSWLQFVESANVLRRFWREGILGYELIAAVKPR